MCFVNISSVKHRCYITYPGVGNIVSMEIDLVICNQTCIRCGPESSISCISKFATMIRGGRLSWWMAALKN